MVYSGENFVNRSIHANNMTVQGNNVVGELIVGSQMSGYHRLATGDIRGLEVVEKDDDATDAGFTMEVNKLINSLYLGDAVSAIGVPALAAGEVAVFRFAAQCDGGQNIVFTLNAAQTFNAEHLPLRAAATGVNPQYTAPTPTVANGLGTGNVAFAATNNKLTLTANATDNQTNVGSYLVFCGTGSNKVSVGFRGMTLGNGAVNTIALAP